MQQHSQNEEMAEMILDFIEVAIHTLLFVRGLYPADIFEQRKKYGMPTWQSRHPALSDAICSALGSARDAMVAGKIESLIFTILDPQGRAVEAYPFDVELAAPEDVPATYSDVDSMMASALCRLMMLESSLPKLSRQVGRRNENVVTCDHTWTLLLSTHERLVGPRVTYDDDDDADGEGNGSGSSAAAAGGGGGKSGSRKRKSGATGVVDPDEGPGILSGTADCKWLRVDPGDPESTLVTGPLVGKSSSSSSSSRSGSASGAAQGTVIKSVRAGRMGIQLRMLRRHLQPQQQQLHQAIGAAGVVAIAGGAGAEAAGEGGRGPHELPNLDLPAR